VRATVLYPPPPQRPYRCDAYGDYVFMVSRLTPLKRADLFVEALAQPEAAGIRAVIAGDGEERGRLQQMIAQLGLSDRVTLAGRLEDAALLDHLARCRAVCFPPFEEDYGFVTAEAFASRKPVVTCRDSGGPAELVEDNVTGFIAEPNSASLAAALRRVMNDVANAKWMGEAAHAAGARMNWADAVRQLTAQ
jgi:glycosyltransferase involved in cell wall biosynthesis